MWRVRGWDQSRKGGGRSTEWIVKRSIEMRVRWMRCIEWWVKRVFPQGKWSCLLNRRGCFWTSFARLSRKRVRWGRPIDWPRRRLPWRSSTLCRLLVVFWSSVRAFSRALWCRRFLLNSVWSQRVQMLVASLWCLLLLFLFAFAVASTPLMLIL